MFTTALAILLFSLYRAPEQEAQAVQWALRTSALQVRTVAFEVAEYQAVQGPAPHRLDKYGYAVRTEWDALIDGARFKVSRYFADDNLSDLQGVKNTFVFDGVTSKGHSINPHSKDGTPVQGGISLEYPPVLMTHHFLAWLNLGINGMGSDGIDSLMRQAGDDSVTGSGENWLVQFQDPFDPHFHWDIQGTQLRTTRIVRTFRETPSESIRFTETFTFDDWREVDGVEIPFHCQVITHYPRGMDGKGTEADSIWGATDMRMIEIGPKIEPTRDTFDIVYDEGTAIHDERYRITYTLGGNRLMIDNRPFMTNEPLTGDVGANLEYWLTQGAFEEVVNVAIVEPPRRQWPWLMIGGVLIAGGIVFWPALRRVGGRFRDAA